MGQDAQLQVIRGPGMTQQGGQGGVSGTKVALFSGFATIIAALIGLWAAFASGNGGDNGGSADPPPSPEEEPITMVLGEDIIGWTRTQAVKQPSTYGWTPRT